MFCSVVCCVIINPQINLGGFNMQQITEICEAVTAQFKAVGYRKRSILFHQQRWNKVIRFMDENEITVYTPDVGLDFLTSVCGITAGTKLDKKQMQFEHSVKLLNDFVEFGTIYPKSPPVSIVKRLARFGGTLEEFKTFRREKYNISETRLAGYDKQIGRVLLHFESKGMMSLSEITASNVYDCCRMFAQMTDTVAYSMSCTVRIFLRYLYEKGVTKDDFSLRIPSFSRHRKTKLPSMLTDKEVSAILDSINRASPGGKRDYAIILLACRLGMRAGDIRTLRFCDICWEQNTISIVTQKTGYATKFPLLSDVGEAIIDYIKNARPAVDNPIIFQSVNAPLLPLTSPAISTIVKKYARKAGVCTAVRHMGSHIFRHTLASNLLKANVPLTMISSVLTHGKQETTSEYYLRVDINQLKRCTLEPPPCLWEQSEEVF
jgi:site-specific recombinase XerD